MRRVAVLFGSDTPIDLAMMRSAEAVARSLGITIAGVDILDGKIERAIADFGKEPDGGLIVLLHRHTLANRGRSSSWRRRISCRRSIHSDHLRPRAGCSPTGPIRMING